MSRAGDADRALTSRRHPLVLRFRRIVARPAIARRSGLFLVDGRHLIEEALAADAAADAIIYTQRLADSAGGRDLIERLREHGWPLFITTDSVLQACVPSETPQGIAGLFRRPTAGNTDLLLQLASLAQQPSASPVRALVLAGLQDPVNIGVLARAAWAFGCPGLITLSGTVDAFHTRALRASAGMLLRLILITDLAAGDLEHWLSSSGIQLVALVPRHGDPIESVAAGKRPCALLLGAEGQGIPSAVESLATQRAMLAMRAEADSIGVASAGTIALYLWASSAGVVNP